MHSKFVLASGQPEYAYIRHVADNDNGWAEQLTARIGAGVKRRRTELGLSAQAVADRTSELGHPIGRGAIARLETGARGMVEVAELFVLSEALETSPVALLWFDAPDTPTAYLPGYESYAGDGFLWTIGERPPSTNSERGTPGESERQFARLGALRRLIDARRALVRLSQSRHPSRSGQQRVEVDMTTLYTELERAEEEAIAHGWTVRRNG